MQSLLTQSVERIDIVASDDGSEDGTLDILHNWAERWPKGSFDIQRGPATGSATDNFCSLILSAPEDYDFGAYCDQDDIWLPRKLEVAIERLNGLGPNAAVHCSRTRLISEIGLSLGLSRYFPKPPSFRNALVQSLAGGNTMVLNRAAFGLVKASLARGSPVAHDWWTYQIVTGAGGRMFYSLQADTLYRQHANNAVGSNVGWRAGLRRMWMVFHGRLRDWNEVNLAALHRCADLLSPEAITSLESYERARQGPVPRRIGYLRRSGTYRQTLSGDLSLWVACVLNLL
jgi:glycosyltransferase involved in cell wall biosynthesis